LNSSLRWLARGDIELKDVRFWVSCSWGLVIYGL
jgi:hypothetical protein